MMILCSWADPAGAAASVGLCPSENGTPCLCISWDVKGGTYIEVRCPEASISGWTTDPNGNNPQPPGSWRGPGSEPEPRTSHPGNPLGLKEKVKWDNAMDIASTKLLGDCENIGGKPHCIPDECGRLFQGNPLGRKGYDLLTNYVIPRGGEGISDAHGVKRCSLPGVQAWTNCCDHNPYVFVCKRFGDLNANDAAMFMIHETLHVAGQHEDTDGATGPGESPNTNQISAAVREACGL